MYRRTALRHVATAIPLLSMTYDGFDSDGIVDSKNLRGGRDASQLKTVTADGNWTWWHEPRAIYYNGKTYVGWISRDGSIEVGAYDHGTSSWTKNTLHAQFDEDDHSNPTFMIDVDGYIWVFHNGHNGTKMRWFKSSNPEDISSFNAEATDATLTDYTYPSPFYFTDGEILAFTRADFGGGQTQYGYQQATDGNNLKWSATQVTDGVNYVKPYRESVTSDIVHFGATTNRHPRRNETGIAYFKYDHSTGDFLDINGNAFTLPISDADLNLIWDPSATGRRAWMWDTATDSNGYPVLVFATFSDNWNEHTYHYATYDGSAWNVEKVCDGGSYIVDQHKEEQYSSGIILDDTDPSVCYVSIGDAYSSKIQRWETDDRGKTWSYQDVVGPQEQNVRPVVPWNRHGDFKLAWMRGAYRWFGKQSMDTKIAWSDGSPTTSVDQPPSNVKYNKKVKLMQTNTFSIAGDFNEVPVSWNTQSFEQGEWWDSSSDTEIRFPEFGYYQINAWARCEPTDPGAWVLDFDDSYLATHSHGEDGEYSYFALTDKPNVKDWVWLQGSKTVVANKYTGDSGYITIRLRQNTGASQDVSACGVSIHQLNP